LAPELSSDVFVGPLSPWREVTDDILDYGKVSSLIIQDIILTEDQLTKLGAIKIDYPLKKLILSNIFGAKNFGCIQTVLGSISRSFKLISQIDISNNAVGPSVDLISNLLQKATSINISNCGLSIEDFNGVAKVFSLDLITLSCCRNYFQGYPFIEHLLKIENINFGSCRIPPEDLNKLITTISLLPSVRSLNISDNGDANGVEDDVMVNLCTKLSVWPEIEEFSLADIGLSTKHSRWILNTLKSGNFKKLQNIDFSFSRLKKIEHLGDYFLRLPALKRLNLTGNKLSEERVTEIQNQLPNCEVLDEEL